MNLSGIHPWVCVPHCQISIAHCQYSQWFTDTSAQLTGRQQKKETNDTQISCVKSLVLPYYSEVSSHSYAGDCWLNLFYYSLLTIIDFTKKSPFCQTIFSSVSRETIFFILTRNNVVAVAADIKSDTGSA